MDLIARCSVVPRMVIARPLVLLMRDGVNDYSYHSNAQDNVVQVRDLMAPLLQEQDTEGVVRRLQMIGMDVLSSTNLQHLCLQRLRAHDGQAKQETLTSENPARDQTRVRPRAWRYFAGWWSTLRFCSVVASPQRRRESDQKGYQTPNQVEQSQKIKRTSASRRPKRRIQQQQQKTESATVTRKAKPI